MVSAIRHEEPDRVPTGENQMDGRLAEQILGKSLLCNTGWMELQALWSGRRDEVVRDYRQVHVELARVLEWDTVRVPFAPVAKQYKPPEMTGEHSWIDEQGYEVHFNPDSGSLIVRSRYQDMDIDDLPDPDEPVEVDGSELEIVRHVVEELGATHFIICKVPVDGTFPWEQTIGMEAFLMRMITDQDFVGRAVEAYVNRSIAYIRVLLEAGADAVMTTDDYSDNRGPIMGVELFRKFVLPGIRRQSDAVHEMGGYFIKHTDGNLWPVLDDLVDAGIDGWHGIQRNIGMDMDRLKARYGDRLCFFGGVNTESLLTGSTSQVREEVRTAIEQAGAGGGLVVASSNVVAPGSKLENYMAMRQAVRDYGSYPLKKMNEG